MTQHNIHKLPIMFDLTYICLEEKLVILWRTYFQRLELISSNSSTDYGHTMDKSLFLYYQYSNPNPKWIIEI